jgi:hypothetical protein
MTKYKISYTVTPLKAKPIKAKSHLENFGVSVYLAKSLLA